MSLDRFIVFVTGILTTWKNRLNNFYNSSTVHLQGCSTWINTNGLYAVQYSASHHLQAYMYHALHNVYELCVNVPFSKRTTCETSFLTCCVAPPLVLFKHYYTRQGRVPGGVLGFRSFQPCQGFPKFPGVYGCPLLFYYVLFKFI